MDKIESAKPIWLRLAIKGYLGAIKQELLARNQDSQVYSTFLKWVKRINGFIKDPSDLQEEAKLKNLREHFIYDNNFLLYLLDSNQYYLLEQFYKLYQAKDNPDEQPENPRWFVDAANDLFIKLNSQAYFDFRPYDYTTAFSAEAIEQQCAQLSRLQWLNACIDQLERQYHRDVIDNRANAMQDMLDAVEQFMADEEQRERIPNTELNNLYRQQRERLGIVEALQQMPVDIPLETLADNAEQTRRLVEEGRRALFNYMDDHKADSMSRRSEIEERLGIHDTVLQELTAVYRNATNILEVEIESSLQQNKVNAIAILKQIRYDVAEAKQGLHPSTPENQDQMDALEALDGRLAMHLQEVDELGRTEIQQFYTTCAAEINVFLDQHQDQGTLPAHLRKLGTVAEKLHTLGQYRAPGLNPTAPHESLMTIGSVPKKSDERTLREEVLENYRKAQDGEQTLPQATLIEPVVADEDAELAAETVTEAVVVDTPVDVEAKSEVLVMLKKTKEKFGSIQSKISDEAYEKVTRILDTLIQNAQGLMAVKQENLNELEEELNEILDKNMGNKKICNKINQMMDNISNMSDILEVENQHRARLQ